jgi:AhpD family alkylhydroperoxidase
MNLTGMYYYKEHIDAIPKPWTLIHSPALGNAYIHFRNAVQEKTVLDEKTGELLMLGLSCVFRCPYCTEKHINKALEAGATKQEAAETLLITSYEGAGTQLGWCKHVYNKTLGEEEQT